MDTMEESVESMDIWISMDSMDIHGCPWISMDVHGFECRAGVG